MPISSLCEAIYTHHVTDRKCPHCVRDVLRAMKDRGLISYFGWDSTEDQNEDDQDRVDGNPPTALFTPDGVNALVAQVERAAMQLKPVTKVLTADSYFFVVHEVESEQRLIDAYAEIRKEHEGEDGE